MSSTLELFGWSIAGTLLAGIVVPWIGCFLYVRKTSFHGIVLPQCAAAGVCCGFFVLPAWGQFVGWSEAEVLERLADPHDGLGYHFFWAGLFTLLGLCALSLPRRLGGREIGRLAAVFAIASAITALGAQGSPIGVLFVEELLRGELLFLGSGGFLWLVIGLGAVAVLLIWFQHDLTLVSFDRGFAVVLGASVLGLELLFFLLTGIAVTVATLTVGPVVLFGLLVLPPIAARLWASSMHELLLVASIVGVLSVIVGLAVALRFDLPVGPCLVMSAAAAAAPGLRRASS